MVKLKDGFTGERALVLPRIIVDKMEEDPLTSMLHITDIGYYPKAKHHFRERKEPINQYVFILKSATTRLYDTEAKIICIVSKKGAQCIECHHKDI